MNSKEAQNQHAEVEVQAEKVALNNEFVRLELVGKNLPRPMAKYSACQN